MPGSRWIRTILLLLVVASCLGATMKPEEMQAALKHLGGTDAEARKHAIEKIETDGDARLVPALEAYRDGLLALRDERLVIFLSRAEVEGRGRVYPLVDAVTLTPVRGADGKPVYEDGLPSSTIRAPRPERARISAIVSSLSLVDPNPAKRRQAIVEAGDRADQKLLEPLKAQLAKEPAGKFAPVLTESIARITLAHGTREEKLAAIEQLGALASGNGGMSLQRALATLRQSPEKDAEMEAAIVRGLASVESYQKKVRFVHHTFAGLSLTSILVLMALGLAIIFGLMGVINMAHGEFMMVGAFTTYAVAEGFRRFAPGAYDWYMVLAIPAAFAVAALAGYVVERLVICRLYGRPLETLLATWGVSLIMIQAARVWFGDTLSVSSPSWLQGGWQVAPDLVLSSLRLFIIGFCAACVVAVYVMIRKTKFGLLLRATTQNRDMASALGVATRRVDGMTFAFGAGLAGLAGVVVPLYNKINPNIGQEYIVESFMVVVVGGVGNFFGVLLGGAGLGFLSKYVEPLFQYVPTFASSASVLGRVAVLVLVVLFLNFRPSGLFPARGRLADA